MSSEIIKLSFSEKTSTGKSSEYAVPLCDETKMSDLYGRYENAADGTCQVQGWSNQELADLYRTHRLLGLAGISTEVDRGLTDEGDPWFVFMDSQNEVFIHFSRIDGIYMVASQVQKSPVWGRSLADLVTEFSKSVLPATEAGSNQSNVVSIARRSSNVVMIHPGAALAALVWSIYLMTDELIAAPSTVTSSMEDLPQVDISDKLADIDVLPALAKKAMITFFDPSLSKQTIDNGSGREAGLSGHFANLHSGMSMKAISVGLSFAAIAAGLPLIDTMAEDATTQANDKPMSATQLYALMTDAKEASAIVSSLADILEDVTAEIHQDKSLVASSSGAITESRAEASGITHVVTPISQVEEPRLSSSGPNSNVGLTHHVKAEILDIVPSQTLTSSVAVTALVSKDLLIRFDDALDVLKLTSLDTLTEQEWTNLMEVKGLSPEIILPDSIVDNSSYTRFDKNAEMYIDYLIKSYGEDNIKIVEMLNEIIIIHTDSLDYGSEYNTIYAKSWSLEDGGFISIVGLKTDMEIFDMAM